MTFNCCLYIELPFFIYKRLIVELWPSVFILWTINFLSLETVLKMLISSVILYYFQWEVKNCNSVYIFLILECFFFFFT